jgi:LPS export ABC transporter protein LptC
MRPRRLAKLLIVLCLPLTAGCGSRPTAKSEPSPPIERPKPTKAVVEVLGGKLYLADKQGKRLWEAQAERIEGDFLSGEGRMEGVKCALLENEKPVISLQAEEASYRPATQEVHLRGEVTADWPGRSLSMSAREVTLSLEKSTLEARGDVVLKRGEESLQGSLLKGDFGLKAMELVDGG